VTRVLSGAVLVVLAVAVVWFAPSYLFIAAALLLEIAAFWEYMQIAAAHDTPVPGAVGAATLFTTMGLVPSASISLDVILISMVIAVGVLALPAWRGQRDALPRAGASLLPILYIGLPIGTLIAIRELHGARGLFLLMLTVMVSDSAQYYSGRLFGKRPLAPAISPKKTIEGAIGGFVFGTALMAVLGAWWLPEVPLVLRIALGAAVVALGIAGDLFESMLKRSAGVKDSGGLIPGHGGVLDRIDALLFAAPIYYVVLKYV